MIARTRTPTAFIAVVVVEKTRNLMNVILIHDLEKLGLPRATWKTDARPPVEIQFVCSMIYFPSARIYLPGDALRCILRRHPPLSGLSIRPTDEKITFYASHPSPLIIKCVLFSAGSYLAHIHAKLRLPAIVAGEMRHKKYRQLECTPRNPVGHFPTIPNNAESAEDSCVNSASSAIGRV